MQNRTLAPARSRPPRAGQARGRSWLPVAGAVFAGLGVTLALAACGGSDGASTTAPQIGTEMGADMGAPMGVPADVGTDAKTPMANPTGVVGDQVVRTAYLSLRVEDVQAQVQRIIALTTAADGTVVDQQVMGQGESINATLTARLPATGLDGYLARVRELGTVDALTVSAQDVTTQAVDLDARIAALQASIRRLSTLMDQASTVADLIAIEAEQTRRQADLDSLVAQRTALGDQVAMSTVTVSLAPIVPTASWAPPGFGPGLAAGWAALGSLVAIAITAAGFLLPFLVLLAVFLVPLTWWLVHRSRASARKRSAQAQGTSASTDAHAD